MRPCFGLFAIICVFVISSCQHEQGIEFSQIADISYSEHVQPLFDGNCVGCHQAGADSAGLKLDSWENLIKGSDFGEAIIAFDAENSVLIEMITKLVGGPHPVEKGAAPLAADAVNFLSRWIDDGARNESGVVPYEASRNLLYVCNQTAASVSVIDTDAQLVIRTVDLLDLGFPITSNPHHLAVEPTGEFWYLSLIGENKVLKFNRRNELIAEATVDIPALLAAHPTNGLLYVSRFPQAPGEIPQLIGVVERSTFEVQDDVAVRPTPHALAADHSGNFIYTCSLSRSEVIVVDSNNEVDEIVPLGVAKGPIQLAVSPDDETLFVSAQIANEMIVLDVSDPDNRRIAAELPVNAMPWHPIVTPTGDQVYVGNNGAHTITAIDVATQAVTVIGSGTGRDGISQPHGIAVSKDGNFVYVSSRNTNGLYQPRHNFGDNDRVGTVVVVDTRSNTITKVLEIEEFGSGMAISEQ